MEFNGMNLDASTSAEVGDLVQSGTRAPSYMSANVGKGLLTSPYGTTNAGYKSPMSAAIQARAGIEADFKRSEIQHRTLRAASEDHIRNLASTTQLAGQEVQMNRQKEMLRNEIDQANKRARGQVLGSVLGIVGAVVGAVVGGVATVGTGAVAGGAAGYAGGTALGNAIGGS